MHLKDKIAIVTGAGIGEAISHKFAHNGAKLVLAGLPSDPVQDVAAAVIANGCDNAAASIGYPSLFICYSAGWR